MLLLREEFYSHWILSLGWTLSHKAISECSLKITKPFLVTYFWVLNTLLWVPSFLHWSCESSFLLHSSIEEAVSSFLFVPPLKLWVPFFSVFDLTFWINRSYFSVFALDYSSIYIWNSSKLISTSLLEVNLDILDLNVHFFAWISGSSQE